MAETIKSEKPERPVRPGFLLHICCAPCSPHPIRVLKENYNLTLYFYNPNIHPESEYLLRLAESKKLAEIENIPLIAGGYQPEKWITNTLQYKNEPERGKRCEICIGNRLEETAKKAAALGKEIFGTVLTVSPHKDAVMINRLGNAAVKGLNTDSLEVMHFEADFKKKDGFKISSRISKELGFKRQSYCGCLYSRLEAIQAGRIVDTSIS
ncbi:MAG: epoxyqueuosine reductase QueH [Nitrospinota bacterium]